MVACAGAVERAVVDVAVIIAYDSAHVGIVVQHVARHAAIFDSTQVLATDAAHLGRIAGPAPIGYDVRAHPTVGNEAVVLAGDAAHQARSGTLDVAAYMQVLYTAQGRNFRKQALIVIRGSYDVELDGVAVAKESSRVRLAAIESQGLPRVSGQVEVGFQHVAVLVIILVNAVAGVVIPVLLGIGQLGRSPDDYNLTTGEVGRPGCRAVPYVLSPRCLHEGAEQGEHQKERFSSHIVSIFV